MTHRRGRPPHPDVLTPAEWRVLDQLREGQPNAEIAVRLGISVNTVRTHVSNMLAKLEVPDRHALAAWDGQPKRRFGWLPPLPPIGLGLGTLGRGAAILGGLAVVAIVVAILLARGGEPQPRTTVVAYTEAGLIGLDPATGVPLAGAVPYQPQGDGGLSYFSIHGDLIWNAQGERDGSTEVAVVDGVRIGLRASGLAADQDDVIRHWSLPPPDASIFATPWLLGVAPNGRTAYVSRSATSSPSLSGGLERIHELWRFDLDGSQPRLLTSSFWVGQIHIGSDGDLFIEPFEGQELIQLDPNNGRELDRIVFTQGRGRSHLANDNRHLYVFHGEETISVVDLDRFAVVDELTLPPGLPSTLGAPWDRALSPDRERLYLAGDDPGDCPAPDPENHLRSCFPQPIGVKAIDLDTMQLLYHDPEHNRLTLSPDGRWLITTLWTYGRDGLSTRPPRGDGLKVIDTSTFEVVAHLEAGKLTFVPAISADGRYAYALQQGPTRPWERRAQDCTVECTSLLVIDLQTFEVIARELYDEDWYVNFLYVVP